MIRLAVTRNPRSERDHAMVPRPQLASDEKRPLYSKATVAVQAWRRPSVDAAAGRNVELGTPRQPHAAVATKSTLLQCVLRTVKGEERRRRRTRVAPRLADTISYLARDQMPPGPGCRAQQRFGTTARAAESACGVLECAWQKRTCQWPRPKLENYMSLRRVRPPTSDHHHLRGSELGARPPRLL